jgi:hypothetical protein
MDIVHVKVWELLLLAIPFLIFIASFRNRYVMALFFAVFGFACASLDQTFLAVLMAIACNAFIFVRGKHIGK